MMELVPLAPEHLEAIVEIVRAEGEHDRHPNILSNAELEEMYDEPHFDPTVDGRLAILDGEPAGWARIWHQPSGSGQERAHLMGTVHPEYRRRGVGSALLEWQLARARERVEGVPGDHPRYIRTMVYEWVNDATALFERNGMVAVRWFDEMLRPLAGNETATPVAGIEIVPWDQVDSMAVRLVKNAAFTDHWGSTPTDEAMWTSWLKGHGIRLDLSYVAMAGTEIVGFSLNEHYPEDEARHGRREGWIGSLGVLRDWRGRGIASALISASMARFVSEGFTHAALGVDSDSPTGAAGLYRRLGFETTHRSVCHEIRV